MLREFDNDLEPQYKFVIMNGIHFLSLIGANSGKQSGRRACERRQSQKWHG